MFVIVIASLSMISGLSYYNSYLDNIDNKVAADQAKLVTDAAKKYIKSNYASVIAAAGVTTPATITVPMLIATGFLPANFSSTNYNGQTYQVLAREPVANKLETLIVTTGGKAITELNTRKIAQLMGAKGGFISSANTTIAQGAYGGWQTTLSNFNINPGAGHYASALFFEDGEVVSDYLYRNAVPGHPELNVMNANLSMNGRDINTANLISAATVNAPTMNSSNLSSTTITATDVNSTRLSGTVSVTSPVVNTTSLSVGGNAWVGGTTNTGALTSNSTASVASNAWIGGNTNTGSLTVNSSTSIAGNTWVGGNTTTGSLNVNGSIDTSGETYTGGWFRSKGNAGWYSELYAGGWHMSDPSWVRSYLDKGIYTGGQILGGSLQSYGRTTVGEYIQLGGVANEGWGCAPTGLIGRNPAGAIVSCDGGIWRKSGGSSPVCSAINIPGYSASDVTTYVCPAGQTKIGWDTTGENWRSATTPGLIIGQNDYATVFCCAF